MQLECKQSNHPFCLGLRIDMTLPPFTFISAIIINSSYYVLYLQGSPIEDFFSDTLLLVLILMLILIFQQFWIAVPMYEKFFLRHCICIASLAACIASFMCSIKPELYYICTGKQGNKIRRKWNTWVKLQGLSGLALQGWRKLTAYISISSDSWLMIYC